MNEQSLETLFEQIDRQLSLASLKTRQETLSPAEQAALTGTHLYYLHTIQGLERPTLTELAKKLNVTKPSVTAVIQKLLQMGYLEKIQSSEDLRVFDIQLTEKGQRVVQIKQKTFQKFADQIRGVLTAEETRQLEQLLFKALRAAKDD